MLYLLSRLLLMLLLIVMGKFAAVGACEECSLCCLRRRRKNHTRTPPRIRPPTTPAVTPAIMAVLLVALVLSIAIGVFGDVGCNGAPVEVVCAPGALPVPAVVEAVVDCGLGVFVAEVVVLLCLFVLDDIATLVEA